MKQSNVAIYVRTATKSQIEDNGIKDQKTSLLTFMATLKSDQVPGDTDPMVYEDGGYSGMTMARQGLENLLRDIRSHKVDVLLVSDLARLSRNVMHLTELCRELKNHSVRLFVATHGTQQFEFMGMAVA